MREGLVTASCALALVVFGGSLRAEQAAEPSVTLTNKSGQVWSLSIITGKVRSNYTLRPDAVLGGVCVGGCIIQLDGADDGSYVLEGNERAAIEDGVIYYDDPVRSGRIAGPDDAAGSGAPQ